MNTINFDITTNSMDLIYRIISRIHPHPPPPIVLVLLSVKTLTVTNNLCDVYKILYYAAVYVRGHFVNMLS